MISGKSRVCGIIANPVEHSMSPLMQNFYASETGQDFVYVPFKVEEKDVEAALKGAYALNVTGLNVTVPHKQSVIPYLTEIDEGASVIGAVNTLVRAEGGFKGYNTDASGLTRAMREEGIAIKGQNCILIGAGGAAKAAAYVLAKEGAASVCILNRDENKAVLLAKEINEKTGREMMRGMALQDYKRLRENSGQYLAVQATSVGMHPHIGEAPIEDPEFYSMIHTGVDVIYTPMETEFMSHVAAAGGRTMNGLAMLLYQGIEAFELWNPGVKVTPDITERAKALVTASLGR